MNDAVNAFRAMFWRFAAVVVLGKFVMFGFSTDHPFYSQAIATVCFFAIFGVCFMSGVEYHREEK